MLLLLLSGIRLKGKIRNSDIRKNTGFEDIVVEMTKNKWNCAALLIDGRWTKEVYETTLAARGNNEDHGQR